MRGDRHRLLTPLSHALQLRLSPDDTDVAGVAVTAALVTASPKKGDHSCHVATHSRSGTRHYALRLAKGARDRAAEVRRPFITCSHLLDDDTACLVWLTSQERVVSTLLIQAAADACGVHTPALVPPLLDPQAEEAVVCEAVEYRCVRVGIACTGL